MEITQIVDKEEEIPLEDTIRDAIRGGDGSEIIKDPELTVVEEKPADTRVRDENGKFAEAPKKRETLTVPKPVENIPANDVVPAPVSSVKAPDAWSAPLKAEFATLKPEVQAEIMRRETEMHRKFTQQDEDRTFGKKIKETAAPYIATIQSEGGTVEQAFQQFLNTAHILRGNNPALKAQALQAIAQQFNVDLSSLQQGGGQTYQQPVFRPEQVTQLVQAEVEKYRQNQEQSELSREIDAFASDPANVHFESVKAVMAALMSSGQAETLKDAYDQAIWARPDIRSTLTAVQTNEQETKRLTEQRARTEQARRAGGSVSGGPGGATPANGSLQNVPLEETIRESLRAAKGQI